MTDKWIPVEERMPEYEVRVLTLDPKRYFCVAIHCLRKWRDERGTWWIGKNNFYVPDGDITHWMPLPSEDLEVVEKQVNNLLIVTIRDVDNALDELGIELGTHDKEALYRYVKDDLEVRVPELVFDAVCDYVYYEDK